MITELLVQNIRLFGGDEWRFPLKPLTVLCGVNSSGKSTLLKSLLLLKQNTSFFAGYGSQGQLRLAGPEVDVGTYKSFVSEREVSRSLALGLTVDTHLPDSLYKELTGSSQQSSLSPGEVLRECTLAATFRFRAAEGSGESEVSSQVTLAPAVLSEAEFSLHAENRPVAQWRIIREPGAEASFLAVFPLDLFTRLHGFDLMEVEKGDKEVSTGTILSSLVPQLLVGKRKRPKAPDEKVLMPFLPPLGQALMAIPSALESLLYLGPLRSPAKRYYVAHVQSDLADPTGEFLPFVLRDQGDTKVTYVPPEGTEAKKETLSEALNEWVHYLRTGDALPDRDEIKVELTQGVLVQIDVKGATGSSRHALADSGFGYSQVLPILIRGLLAPIGSTLIVEQPELHLNPALQVRLANFFIAMIRAKKQVILETHSEHIVNAIRVLCAEDDTDALAEKASVLFLDVEDSIPVIRNISIQSDGTAPDWPKHFFGEAIHLTGRLLRAQRNRRSS